MNRLALTIALVCAAHVAVHVAVGDRAYAAETIKCTDLPPVAWHPAPKTQLFLLNLDRVTSAKELYLQAVCGANPAAVWGHVLAGTGGIIEVPESLAKALDKATPHLPHVRYMYVRGGGRDLEVIVVLFADGYDGPFFEVDKTIPWEREWTERTAKYWNLVPYPMLVAATRWLHDVALFEEHYTVHTEMFGGAVQINLYESDAGRGIASPLGTVFAARQTAKSGGAEFWHHELGHYVHYEESGANALAWVDEFTGISRRNAVLPIVQIPIPFLFKELYQEANDDVAEVAGDCKTYLGKHGDAVPWGYTSAYARCGEHATEDFADTLMAALGGTFGIQGALVSGGTVPLGLYRTGFYAPERLFDRGGAGDAGVIGQKLAYMRARFGFELYEIQDADGDGVPWAWGLSGADCDDTNPVIGACATTTCQTAADCDDGDPCTVDYCGESHLCRHDIVDADGDGSPDPYVDTNGDGVADKTCGGTDCDPTDASVYVGSSQSCTNKCGFASTRVCIGPGFSECVAPPSCECQPGEIRVVPCTSRCDSKGRPGNQVDCNRCGSKTLRCENGAWVDPGTCDTGTEGACASGHTNDLGIFQIPSNSCGGYDTVRKTETCSASCSGFTVTTKVIASNPNTSAETCDGRDNDCDGTIDEACPSSVTLGTPTLTSWAGGNGGSAGAQSCPAGSVLVGVELRGHKPWNVLSTVVDGIMLRCRPLQLDTSAKPTYTFKLGALTTRPWLGSPGSEGSKRVFDCAAGEVVTGFDVKPGWYVDTLQVRCGKPRITGSIGSYTVAMDAKASVGYAYGAAPTTSLKCSSSRIVTGISVRSGTVIDALAAQCALPSLRLIQ